MRLNEDIPLTAHWPNCWTLNISALRADSEHSLQAEPTAAERILRVFAFREATVA
jgi:hypothetical protein